MIDFHCHLDLYPNARRLIDEVAVRNLFTLVVTTSPRAWLATSRVFAGHSNVKIALGMHPEIVEKKIAERGLLISNVSRSGFIGEVGIDGSKEHRSTLTLQESILQEVFTECELCGGKIISIHSRNAATRVLDLVEKCCQKSVPILHWFSGTVQEARRAVAMGCWFSVGPAMLRGANGQTIFRELPKDKILPETDGPFAKNGAIPFMPWDAMIIAEPISVAWNTTRHDVQSQFKRNLNTLLNAVEIYI